MRIEILCTGDEILTGKTINTNYSHMARRLVEVDLGVTWGTVVGDDREALRAAFREAARRADVVIVNGGLGPTVDDLSQEMAAEAAGVPLVLHEPWLARMEAFYASRNRPMPPNNRKQAMLPQGAEFIDNPIGTACGFAVTIGDARFYFTPGVPREMHRMLDEQIIPRLLAMEGRAGVTRLKRFHSFGIGESRADQMLDGLEAMAPEGAVKLGFQAHYPQLETKLAARAADSAALEAILAPLEAEVRRRLGNFIVAEDAQSLEGAVIAALGEGTLAVAETLTGGGIAARLVQVPGAETRFRRGLVLPPMETNGATALAQAAKLRAESGASHALAVLAAVEKGGGRIAIGLVDGGGEVTREALLVGDRERVRLGAAEMGLDVLRRRLQGLPVDEAVDFERKA
ncbi:CinA family nicotinamide mononucleotide deamidase-related protein [Siccirubricoccus sp. KC 17139]|uniref:CinA-like protein n=1 Tax=Siccirubricoccus soli TaxID=2899147 RepID=A0ABT1D3A0_9PROT|nr:CinA family nicotinamide mononucleotide deamidase-related protein [Siccirubricoccus soli]MCO6416408.1 CinA family nicotinamide mononucleotide deamidase-related protein [Siccirubricoccus soli]MCP2682542.1 CinA family nicotinamide mononucleotide deamidase-related protein [Siccirubricoccus soli]